VIAKTGKVTYLLLIIPKCYNLYTPRSGFDYSTNPTISHLMEEMNEEEEEDGGWRMEDGGWSVI
jgi:hypothetical protein